MNTLKDDVISRQAAIDYCQALINAENPSDEWNYSQERINQTEVILHHLEVMPSAQPNLDEWCDDCKEYDKERHSCPRWNRVIRQTVEDMKAAQPGWIPWDSGRFPEESGTYTVTAYDGAKRRVTYAKYQKRLKRWELTGARAYWRVLAWMEKPEPWEGGNNGKT